MPPNPSEWGMLTALGGALSKCLAADTQPMVELFHHARCRIPPKPSECGIGTSRGGAPSLCLLLNTRDSHRVGDRDGGWWTSFLVPIAATPCDPLIAHRRNTMRSSNCGIGITHGAAVSPRAALATPDSLKWGISKARSRALTSCPVRNIAECLRVADRDGPWRRSFPMANAVDL